MSKGDVVKIGVVGLGVVGGAVYSVFKERGLDVSGFDSAKPEAGTFEDVIKADVLFLCLPTPTSQYGVQDLSALRDVAGKLKSAKYQGVVVIKSTVLPGTTVALAQEFELNAVHNPEFLTAATPVDDFKGQPAVLIGGPLELTMKVAEVYLAADFHVVKQYDRASSTELAKYMHNVFLATKVSLFNEFHEFATARHLDFSDARDGALAMKQIGSGHTRVPGPDKKPGFGGMCFVKDTLAYLAVQTSLKLGSEVTAAVVTQNKRLRPEEYHD